MDGEKAKALTADQIEPCPWCGSVAEVSSNDDDGSAPWMAAWVQCTKRPGCEVEGAVVKLLKIQDAKAAAIAAWNRVATATARASRLEAEAAALRMAVEYVASALRLVIAGKPCTFVDEALSASTAALAPGAGERVAKVLAKVRHLREWERGSAERADQPRGAFDDSAEIEWDRRVDAVCAALDALDGGKG